MNTIEWQDAAREAAFTNWLKLQAHEYGLDLDSVSLAASDAGFRRYLRVRGGTGKTFIVMDAPPEKEDCSPFVAVQQLLVQADIHVPEILQWDKANGFMLLTDLGQKTLLQWLLEHEKPASSDNFGSQGLADNAHPYFMDAIDSLITLQSSSRPDVLPAYDAQVLRRELQLFPDWYLQQYRQAALDAAQTESLNKVFERIVQENLASPNVYVHRDFMPRNLMMPTAENNKLGVLDFQDALYGPITYDIASLLRDAFWTWEEDFILDVTVRYWERARKHGLLAKAPEWESDFGLFYRAVDWMALQRHLKVAGIFARLSLRDGKHRYLADTPRFINYIRATASRYRELTPLLRLIDQIENTELTQAFSFGRV